MPEMADPTPITITELAEPPPVDLRRLPALVAAAVRMAWAAAPRELLLVFGLQAIGGLGLIAPILAGRDLLNRVMTTGGFEGVLLPGALVLVLLGVTNLAGLIATARDDILSELLNRYATRRILLAAGEVELEEFERPGFHNRLERATTSAALRPYQLAQGLGGLAQALLGAVGVAVALAAIEPLLLPVTVAAAVPLWVAGVRSGHVLYAALMRLTPAERERSYLVYLLTRRESAVEVRAYGLSRYLRDRWERRTDERMVEIRRTVRTRLKITLLARLTSGAVLAGVLALLVLLTTAGRLTVADAGAAAGAVLLLAARLRVAATGTDQLFEAAPFVADLRGFIAAAPGRPGQPGVVPAAEAAGSAGPAAGRPAAAAGSPNGGRPRPARAGFDRLTVTGLHFTYPAADRPALRGVDLCLHSGEVVALVGENGSGKTTLAKLLGRLYRPQAGRISLDGTDLADLPPGTVHDNVAVLFQDFQRYLLPAADNIAAGRWQRSGDQAAVVAAATAAGAHPFLSTLPDGYGTLLGPQFAGGTDLSGGQWQRVALARAFFRDAPFVILDEPTATLDARAEAGLFDRIRALLAGRTVLLISHRFSTVRSADRIYVLAGGQVVEHGTHAELMALGGRYAELFTLQAAGYLDPAPPP
jgi:ATP-binding cassette subfamily B protein